MTCTRIAVKENFDEDDLSDDVDDEVFVRDGKKSILKTDKPKGDERPLMAPRRKSKQKQHNSNAEVCSRQPCNIYNCLLPFYFGIATIISIAFLMLLYIFLVDKLPLLVNKFGIWSTRRTYEAEIIPGPCKNFKVDNIWTRTIPKLTSDSQIRLIDVNKDNVEDVVMGIGTELDDLNNGDRLCAAYFDKISGPCSGGVVALDGKTGNIIWHRWLRRLVLSIHCNLEITGDFISDCIATGKGGLLVAISGADGTIIWEGEKSEKDFYIDLYNVLIIHDIDSDNHMDILVSHTSGDEVLQSNIRLISGKDGNKIQRLAVAEQEPILHAPQIMTDVDGNEIVIFISGDLTHPGGIYITSIYDLLKADETRVKKLYHYETGILSAPILVDVNLDGLQDIVYIAGSNVYALDGVKYTILWNVSLYDYVSNAYQITTTSSITPAYFDNDWVPDFLISFAVGATYPQYYYSMTLVLNGKNGVSLLKEPIIRSGVADTVGGLALSIDGIGNDAFIYWTAACQGRENSKDPFGFKPKENRQFWADLCGLRFNSTLNLQLFAISQHVKPPGVLLYSAKSHTVDVPQTDTLNYRPINSLEMSERIPMYYNMRPRSKDNMSPIAQQMQMDNEVQDDKQYNINENEWPASKPRYQGNNEPMNYDVNDNTLYQSNDYEIDNDAPIPGRSEKEYGKSRFRRSFERPTTTYTSRMIPKVSSSGIITKSFDGNNLDLILSHYEVKSDDTVDIIIGKQEECIQNGIAFASIPSSQYHGLPQDKLQEKVYNDCRMSSTNIKSSKKTSSNLQMGNLYITRNRISCECDSEKRLCNPILPYEKQSYPAYLGKYENSAYKTRSTFDEN